MTTPLIPDPRGLIFQDWGAQLIINVTTEPLAIPPSEEGWRDYAAYLSQTAALSGYSVPNPYGVENWQDWAQSLVACLN